MHISCLRHWFSDTIFWWLTTNVSFIFCHNNRQIIGHYLFAVCTQCMELYLLYSCKHNSQTIMKNCQQYHPYNAYFMRTFLIWWYVLVTKYQRIFHFSQCNIMLNSNVEFECITTSEVFTQIAYLPCKESFELPKQWNAVGPLRTSKQWYKNIYCTA